MDLHLYESRCKWQLEVWLNSLVWCFPKSWDVPVSALSMWLHPCLTTGSQSSSLHNPYSMPRFDLSTRQPFPSKRKLSRVEGPICYGIRSLQADLWCTVSAMTPIESTQTSIALGKEPDSWTCAHGMMWYFINEFSTDKASALQSGGPCACYKFRSHGEGWKHHTVMWISSVIFLPLQLYSPQGLKALMTCEMLPMQVT